jgi:uncharacterized protein YggE
MRTLIVAALLAATAWPALAQTAPASGGQAGAPRLYDPSPWWMRESVIASTGHVRTEIASNRANFSASFQAVERTAADATRIAADKVRALGQALAAYGPAAVRVETTFNMRPLYDQYRDENGRLIDNQRADQIERYEVNAQVSIEVREVANLERVYATVLAARPNATTPVYFRLEPDNETRTELFGLAVADAARRARLATEATGARLGPVKLIDPTARACQTDVLVAGAPRNDAVGDTPYQDVMVTAQRVRGAPPPPPAPMMAEAAKADGAGGQTIDPASMQLPLQPPLQELTAAACVVYALG